jgi:hypothetical protein
MEIKGKVIQVLAVQSGEGQRAWRKQDFIIETPSQYPKKVCISLWGDKIEEANLQIGEEIIASIDIESREYNGRWYTNVKAWKIDKQSADASQEDLPPPPAPVEIPDEDENVPLPF